MGCPEGGGAKALPLASVRSLVDKGNALNVCRTVQPDLNSARRCIPTEGRSLAVSFASQAVVSGLSNPTTLQFGPDGRLYVAQQDGLIKIYDVTQPSARPMVGGRGETLSLIKGIPNHNDDGSLNTSITDRQVTASWSPAPPPIR